MRIVLIGYGKMGKAIEAIALERGHTITGKIDVGDMQEFPPSDVAIEFTQPSSAVQNIRRCADAQIPVVCGTTGWQDLRDEVTDYVKNKNSALLWSSNFSPGVNLFFHLNEYLSRMMKNLPGYTVSLNETHHTQKKDAPSGTAITLAEGILKNNPYLTHWALPQNATPGALVIHPHRKDPAPGTHSVRYSSSIDDIEIIHTAHSREGFAYGAVMAAEWLAGKQGVFTMSDLFKF